MLFSRRFLLGVAVSLAFIALFFFNVNLGEMGEALQDANYGYIAPAVALYFAALLFRAYRWQYLLSPLAKINALRLFPVVSVGYMANNLLPARLGEVARAYYLSRREGVSASAGLGTVIVERVYDGVTLLFLAGLAVPFLVFGGLVEWSGSAAEVTWAVVGLATALVFIGAVVFLALLTVKPGFGDFIQRLTAYLPAGIRPRAREFIRLFIEGLTSLRSPRQHLGLFLLSLPVWLLEGSMYLLVAFSFDLHEFFTPAVMVIPVVLLVTAVSNLATAIPSSPGSLGTFELPAVAALALVGVGASTTGGEGVAGAYVFLAHLTALLPVTVLGLLYLWLGNTSLPRLLRKPEARPAYPTAVSELTTGQEQP